MKNEGNRDLHRQVAELHHKAAALLPVGSAKRAEHLRKAARSEAIASGGAAPATETEHSMGRGLKTFAKDFNKMHAVAAADRERAKAQSDDLTSAQADAHAKASVAHEQTRMDSEAAAIRTKAWKDKASEATVAAGHAFDATGLREKYNAHKKAGYLHDDAADLAKSAGNTDWAARHAEKSKEHFAEADALHAKIKETQSAATTATPGIDKMLGSEAKGSSEVHRGGPPPGSLAHKLGGSGPQAPKPDGRPETTAAYAASERANKSPGVATHREAYEAHKAAMNVAIDQGNTRLSREHGTMASKHAREAREIEHHEGKAARAAAAPAPATARLHREDADANFDAGMERMAKARAARASGDHEAAAAHEKAANARFAEANTANGLRGMAVIAKADGPTAAPSAPKGLAAMAKGERAPEAAARAATARAATATKASSAAHAAGTPEAHKKAVDVHNAAARLHAAAGNDKAAATHRELAATHKGLAKEAEAKAKGDGTFDEAKHPRAADGKFD